MTGRVAGRRLVRVGHPDGRVRAAVVEGDTLGLLAGDDLTAILEDGVLPEVTERVTVSDPDTLAPADSWRLLVPVVAPETWAAGVTYERSREARRAESQGRDVYDLIYDAERPELFLKDAGGRRTVGPGGAIAARSDATWTVPEPELAVVLGADARPLAVTIGNDVSSRDIEGANPLYLPQAKIYGGACALGPAVFVPEDWRQDYDIELRIVDEDGKLVFTDQTSTTSMCRSVAELTDYLRRDNPVPAGSVLLTGTGIVPPDEVTLTAGTVVEIRIAEIGLLRNPVGAERKPGPGREVAVDG
jgi:2-dehydro-3-deoxy-D-arabinonate dehydratase